MGPCAVCLACAPTHAATPLATAHRLTHRVSTRVETGEPEQAETAQPTTQRQCPNRREHPAPCVTLCNWKSCAHTNNSSLGRSHARRRLQLWYTHRTVVGAGAPALSLSHSHKLSKHTGKHTDISSRAAHSRSSASWRVTTLPCFGWLLPTQQTPERAARLGLRCRLA